MLDQQVKVDMTIVFDGGSRGNPGLGYGSFRLADREGHVEIIQLKFGDKVTNNQAEYRTFIAALEKALEHAESRGWRPRDLRLTVRGDSDLLVKQVLGQWKVKNADLKPLWTQARALITKFGSVDLAWWSREHSVKFLGH